MKVENGTNAPTEQAARTRGSGIHLPRWGLSLILAGSNLLAACVNTERPSQDSERNAPNAQGDYAALVKRGACAPFDVPNWKQHGVIEFRCVSLNGEIDSRVSLVTGPDNSVALRGPSDVVILSGQNYRFDQRYGSIVCTYEVQNRGQQQPLVNLSCRQ